eukprot:m.33293 g.33293  ORF g.33293 m.33293 type:complete len:508 (+) comp5005_c0_seq1:99-1622(+)
MLGLVATVVGVAATGAQSKGYSCVEYPVTSAETIQTCSGRGMIEDSTLGLTEAVWVGPESKHVYVGSPTILKVPMPGGTARWLVAHDFFGASTLNATVQVLGTDSSPSPACCPAEFQLLSTVQPMYWANLFAPPGAAPGEAYIMGTSGGKSSTERCQDVVIAKTTDGGATWTESSVLFKCHDGTAITYHTAPTPVLVASSGRLYRAFEMNGVKGAVVVSTTAPYTPSTNLLDPSVWVRSDTLMFNHTAFVPPAWGNGTFVWEEGNAVEGPNGEIYDILRIDGQTTTAYNKAAITQLNLSTGALTFVKMIDFPSCPSKFVIRRDPTTKLYYTLSTDVTPQAVEINTVFARNHLIMAVSADLETWKFCDTLLTDDTGFPPADSAQYTGFHYVDWQFDNSDIVFAARTGYRGSNSFHNANRLTVKREENYVKRCAYLSTYADVGYGWCRPVEPWTNAGIVASYAECADACTASAGNCSSFACSDAGTCALYQHVANDTSGESGVRCFTRQ